MTNSINGTPLTNRGVANTLNSVQSLDNKGLDGKYPNGLKNFILAGQYIVQSGGLPSAVMSGRFSAQRICHDDKKKFIEP